MGISNLLGIKTETSLVSVVIPVYNVKLYLRQCLDSVINQTYRYLEIVLIDDGSTDGSGSICDEYALLDTRIRAFHTTNKGLASARNFGMEHAKGEFLSFVDSDDWIELNTIETLVNTAIKTGADIVTAGVCSECIGRSIPSQKMNHSVEILQGESILLAYANGAFGNTVWDKLYRTECYSNIRFPDGHNYEDVVTTTHVMKDLVKREGSIAIRQEDLFHFRMRKSSISHTRSFSNIDDHWNAYLSKLEEMPEYKEQLITSCFTAIGRMWKNYSRFSKADKQKAKATIQEMQSFSKQNFHYIMSGRFDKLTKIACVTSLSKSPITMFLCYFGECFSQMFRNKKYKLFK